MYYGMKNRETGCARGGLLTIPGDVTPPLASCHKDIRNALTRLSASETSSAKARRARSKNGDR